MRCEIDWLSFTVPIYAGVENAEGFAVAIENGLYDLFGQHIVKQIFGGKWEERKGGRAPYSNSYDCAGRGIVVFANPKINHILVEVSGTGCEYIRNTGLENGVLEMAQMRLSRLDMAVDIETDIKPSDFAPKAQYASTISYSELNSKTGQTVYLGSTTSERYTRVYRYFHPHPRSKFLRVEFVFRRKVARVIGQEILVQGRAAVAELCGRKARFTSPVWQPSDKADNFYTYSGSEREGGKTLFWLVNSVAPAFKRLVREGVIVDADKFLTSYFLSE